MPTEKQKRFVAEYLIDLNATRAAERAGYSAKTADRIGSRLLTNVEVAEAIAAGQSKILDKLSLSAEWVLQRLMWRADFDVRAFHNDDGTLKPIKELDDKTAFALQGIEIEKLYEHFGRGQAQNTGTVTKFKYADRDRSLELLGRHLKLFTDKVDLAVSGKLSLESVLEARKKAGK